MLWATSREASTHTQAAMQAYTQVAMQAHTNELKDKWGYLDMDWGTSHNSVLH